MTNLAEIVIEGLVLAAAEPGQTKAQRHLTALERDMVQLALNGLEPIDNQGSSVQSVVQALSKTCAFIFVVDDSGKTFEHFIRAVRLQMEVLRPVVDATLRATR